MTEERDIASLADAANVIFEFEANGGGSGRLVILVSYCYSADAGVSPSHHEPQRTACM
jgi:hypothetical protein